MKDLIGTLSIVSVDFDRGDGAARWEERREIPETIYGAGWCYSRES